mgnify:CR=1 FL=1
MQKIDSVPSTLAFFWSNLGGFWLKKWQILDILDVFWSILRFFLDNVKAGMIYKSVLEVGAGALAA